MPEESPYLSLDPSNIKKTYVHKVDDLPVSYPGYAKITDDEGKMPDELSLKYDDAALKKLTEYALSQGKSPWALIKSEQLEREGLRGMDEATQQAMMRARAASPRMSGEAAARNLMAERLGRGTQATGQAQQQQLGVDLKDRMEKMGSLRQLPGMEVRASMPQQFNIKNAMDQMRQEREAEREAWKQKMAWSGSQEIAKSMRE